MVIEPWEIKNLLLVPSARIYSAIYKVLPTETGKLSGQQLLSSTKSQPSGESSLQISGLAGERLSIQVGWARFASAIASNPTVYIRFKWNKIPSLFPKTINKNTVSKVYLCAKELYPEPSIHSAPLPFSTKSLGDSNADGEYPQIAAYFVEIVSATVPAPANPDNGYLFTEPALVPDRLMPIPLRKRAVDEFWVSVCARHSGYNSIWVDLKLPVMSETPNETLLLAPEKQIEARDENGVFNMSLDVTCNYQLAIDVFTVATPGLPRDFIAETSDNNTVNVDTDLTISENGSMSTAGQMVVDITQVNLPLKRPSIVNTQWMHVDSLAIYHQIQPWSETHWQVTEAHLESMARMGINSTMIPLWTPSLDIEVGSYRENVQLIDITRDIEGHYQVDFSRAIRFVEIMKAHGFTAVEAPPLYTQWGAKSCPRFYVRQLLGEGKKQLVAAFGWDCAANDREYQQFLQEILPPVRAWLESQFGSERVFFHISDEPNESQVENYQQARAQVNALLQGAQVIDALSDPQYLTQVEIPVVATDAVSAFRVQGVEPNWVYYCVSQNRQVVNRFVAQRPIRHRALGFQIYKNRATGFLHWAFNFYNSQFSRFPICPYTDNAAGGGFISGDAFVVYPHQESKNLYHLAEVWLYESLRHRMIASGWDDLAVCQLAEAVIGRKAVLAIIDPDGHLDYQTGWVSETEHLRRRHCLNMAIAAALSEA